MSYILLTGDCFAKGARNDRLGMGISTNCSTNPPSSRGPMGSSRALFVDLGYGFDARTTLESAARFRRVHPDLPILGVEIEEERVEAALPHADEKTFFRLGGFNLPLKEGEHVRLIRAFNVLRQYEEKDFAPAYERLAQYMLPGGLMIEGTSNPFGSVWVANLGRKAESGDWREKTGDWRLEALVFSTNFRPGFDITDFSRGFLIWEF